MAYFRAGFRISERRACRVAGAPRSTCRYRSAAADQAALRIRLRDLAAVRVRYGYRRLHVLLQREGWRVNHKRVYRLYREEGLAIRVKRRTKRVSMSRVRPTPAGAARHRLDPPQAPTLEGGRVEGGKDPAEGVVGGNAMGQREKRSQPRLLAAAEELNVDPAVGPAQDGEHRDGHDVHQLVAHCRTGARIGQCSTIRLQGGPGERIHGGLQNGRPTGQLRSLPISPSSGNPHHQMRLPWTEGLESRPDGPRWSRLKSLRGEEEGVEGQNAGISKQSRRTSLPRRSPRPTVPPRLAPQRTRSPGLSR